MAAKKLGIVDGIRRRWLRINSFSGDKNWEFVGAVLQKQVLPNLAIGAEVYHQTVYQADFPNDGTAFKTGTIIGMSEQHHLLFRLAVPLTAR